VIHGSNAKAPFVLAQEAIPHLAATRGPIVNHSSILGPALITARSLPASKAAVVGM